MRFFGVFHASTLVRSGSASWVIAAVLAIGASQTALAQGATGQDGTVQDQTARAQAALNHTGGFRCDPTTTPVCNPSAAGVPTATGLPQGCVKAFNTVNLFFKDEVPAESFLLRDLSFALNVNNVFDTDPPIFRQINANTPGYANGFTLGRLVQIGVQKKF